MKRLIDLLGSLVGLLVLSPVLLIVMLLIWLQDFHSPFYIAPRVGKSGKLFRMVKMRSMVVNADKSGVDSTSGNDQRITAVGSFVRKFKLDEFTQLWNVLIGDMSLVGPRPNVERETKLYTEIEKGLLVVRPGVTDISSIVFSDEGDILRDSKNPDLDYNQLIRPWKSRLGLLYIEKKSIFLDLEIIMTTLIAILSRERALKRVNNLLNRINAQEELIRVSLRATSLSPYPPPGSETIVTSR